MDRQKRKESTNTPKRLKRVETVFQSNWVNQKHCNEDLISSWIYQHDNYNFGYLSTSLFDAFF